MEIKNLHLPLFKPQIQVFKTSYCVMLQIVQGLFDFVHEALLFLALSGG
jgi:hypothetical protein